MTYDDADEMMHLPYQLLSFCAYIYPIYISYISYLKNALRILIGLRFPSRNSTIKAGNSEIQILLSASTLISKNYEFG